MTEESGLIEDARRALPAVVQIIAEGYDGNNLQSLLNPRFLVPAEWAGSGFLIRIDGKPGYVLTNNHVVANARKIKIKSVLTSEELFQVEIVGAVSRGDPDLALLELTESEKERFKRVSQTEIPFLELGDSTVTQRGMQVKAIGYPYGMPEPNISGGEISNFLSGDDRSSERLVTDAAINPGNSGGPAIIEGGKVIGINTSIIIDANNIGFITPIHFFKILLPSLLGHGAPGLTDLAARFQPNSEALAKYFGQERPEGLVISRLVPGGMLAQAGIERGDVLLSLAGHTIDRYGNAIAGNGERKVNILDISREIPLDKEVEISYFRDKKVHAHTAKTMPLPTFGVRFQPAIQNRHYLLAGGMLIQQLSYEIVDALSGALDENYWEEIEASKYSENPFLVVSYIDSDTQAENLCLELGEVISKINDVKFEGSLKDLSDLLKDLKQSGKNHVLIEFRSGSFGHFSLQTEFDDLEVKSCCLSQPRVSVPSET